MVLSLLTSNSLRRTGRGTHQAQEHHHAGYHGRCWLARTYRPARLALRRMNTDIATVSTTGITTTITSFTGPSTATTTVAEHARREAGSSRRLITKSPTQRRSTLQRPQSTPSQTKNPGPSWEPIRETLWYLHIQNAGRADLLPDIASHVCLQFHERHASRTKQKFPVRARTAAVATSHAKAHAGKSSRSCSCGALHVLQAQIHAGTGGAAQ
jgi:hypothetical protein